MKSMYGQCRVHLHRYSFMRIALGQQILTSQQLPVMRIRRNSDVHVYARSGFEYETLIPKLSIIHPPEFEIGLNLPLPDKWLDCANTLMIREERVWLNLLTHSDSYKPLVIRSVEDLFKAKDIISAKDAPVSYIFIGRDVWGEWSKPSSEFYSHLEPTTQDYRLEQGNVADIHGMAVYTDAYRNPKYTVFNCDEIFLAASPICTGQFTERPAATNLENDNWTPVNQLSICVDLDMTVRAQYKDKGWI